MDIPHKASFDSAALTDENIRAFWSENHLGEIRTIRRATGGVQNHVVYVN